MRATLADFEDCEERGLRNAEVNNHQLSSPRRLVWVTG
jgi:hypothetical protein